MNTIVLDPGHGGNKKIGGSSPNNASGPNGLLEKDLTLDLATRVRDRLQGHANVILTRTTDVNLGLADRARVAHDHNAAAFLSIHFNGYHDANVDGTEVWIANNPTGRSQQFAQTILDQIIGVTNVRNRGVRQQDFGVLVPTRHQPNTSAALLEVAFLTNPVQANRLADTGYRNQLSEAIAVAIRQHVPSAQPEPAAQGFGYGGYGSYGQPYGGSSLGFDVNANAVDRPFGAWPDEAADEEYDLDTYDQQMGYNLSNGGSENFVTFPSGETLQIVSGYPDGNDEDYWDPVNSGNPLLDSGTAHKDKKLSANFSVNELVSSGGVSSDVARINPKLVECLQTLRNHLGKPITITSGYRSWKRNKRVYQNMNPPQKPTKSRHCAGQAADIKVRGMTGLELAKAAIDACGCNIAIGVGPAYIHIDVRSVPAFWGYGKDKQELTQSIKAYHRQKCSN